jgi:hypothetical protein
MLWFYSAPKLSMATRIEDSCKMRKEWRPGSEGAWCVVEWIMEVEVDSSRGIVRQGAAIEA